MIRITVAGACGRMGRRILEGITAQGDMAIAGGFDIPELGGTEITTGVESGNRQVVQVSGKADEALRGSDVLIDFTLPEACIANVQTAVAEGIPAVIGTTGLSAAQCAELKTLSEKVAIVHAPNMSVGVNLLFQLTAQVARVLGLDYNIEIVEMHHNQKQDSPSGTALRLAERAAEGLDLNLEEAGVYGRQGQVGKRSVREIGVHAVRGGDVVGEHTVCFAGPGERVELTHRAHSRDNFARGALVAARFAVSAAPGLYDMQDVLGLK